VTEKDEAFGVGAGYFQRLFDSGGDILKWLKSQLEIEGDTHPSP